MVVAYTRRAGVMVVGICLLLAGFGHCPDANAEEAGSKKPAAAPTASGNNTEKTPEGESTEDSDPSGFVEGIGEQLHQVARKERIATLAGVDKQRRETLVYLTRERRMTMIALEAVGNRIAENTLRRSEQLIDHFFVRAMQLLVVIILAGFFHGLFFLRPLARGKSQL